MTTWRTKQRLGGAYLTDKDGNYIVTSTGDKIIVLIYGGDLQNAVWTPRTVISTTTWTTRVIPN